MDNRCVVCGEPWDIDTAWEFVGEDADEPRYSTIEECRKAFRVQGCKAYGATHNQPTTETDRVFGLTPQVAAAALYDILGDDEDGVASMLDDMF